MICSTLFGILDAARTACWYPGRSPADLRETHRVARSSSGRRTRASLPNIQSPVLEATGRPTIIERLGARNAGSHALRPWQPVHCVIRSSAAWLFAGSMKSRSLSSVHTTIRPSGAIRISRTRCPTGIGSVKIARPSWTLTRQTVCALKDATSRSSCQSLRPLPITPVRLEIPIEGTNANIGFS